jgi:hypothetical protein
MPKKISKLKQAHAVHGKLEPEEVTAKKTYRTLDQIFGDTGLSKYQTLDSGEYESQLKEMNLSDLQNHASKLGIFPNDNRDRLTKNLLREFSLYASQYINKDNKATNSSNSKPISSAVKKILSEGR